MVKYYLVFASLLILHEFGHYMAIKICKVKIYKMVIGNMFYLNVKNFKLSPIILSCYVDFSEEDYNRLNLVWKLIIIAAGPFMNLLFALLSPNKYIIAKLLALFLGVSSLLPIPFLDTDGGNLIKEIFLAIKRRKI